MTNRYDPDIEFSNAIYGDLESVFQTWFEEEWESPEGRVALYLSFAYQMIGKAISKSDISNIEDQQNALELWLEITSRIDELGKIFFSDEWESFEEGLKRSLGE